MGKISLTVFEWNGENIFFRHKDNYPALQKTIHRWGIFYSESAQPYLDFLKKSGFSCLDISSSCENFRLIMKPFVHKEGARNRIECLGFIIENIYYKPSTVAAAFNFLMNESYETIIRYVNEEKQFEVESYADVNARLDETTELTRKKYTGNKQEIKNLYLTNVGRMSSDNSGLIWAINAPKAHDNFTTMLFTSDYPLNEPDFANDERVSDNRGSSNDRSSAAVVRNELNSSNTGSEERNTGEKTKKKDYSINFLLFFLTLLNLVSLIGLFIQNQMFLSASRKYMLKLEESLNNRAEKSELEEKVLDLKRSFNAAQDELKSSLRRLEEDLAKIQNQGLLKDFQENFYKELGELKNRIAKLETGMVMPPETRKTKIKSDTQDIGK